jgi:hypothetical protein
VKGSKRFDWSDDEKRGFYVEARNYFCGTFCVTLAAYFINKPFGSDGMPFVNFICGAVGAAFAGALISFAGRFCFNTQQLGTSEQIPDTSWHNPDWSKK